MKNKKSLNSMGYMLFKTDLLKAQNRNTTGGF